MLLGNFRVTITLLLLKLSTLVALALFSVNAWADTTFAVYFEATGSPIGGDWLEDDSLILSVSSFSAAPPSMSHSNCGSVDLYLEVNVSGSTLAPTATGSATVEVTSVAQAAAGSRINSSSHGESASDSESASASASGAQTQYDGPNSSDAPFTIAASNIVWTSLGGGNWRGRYKFHTSSMSASTSATAPTGNKGSSATGTAQTKLAANFGYTSNTLVITTH